MPKIHINRSIEIHSPASDIFEVLIDFKQWTDWSPWLILEKETSLEFAPEGNAYQWEGKKIGSGRMAITHKTLNAEIRYELQFLKPFKSRAKIMFSITDKGESCNVSWVMDSSLPFYMGWMKKPMIANMNADYDRGLLMLKDYIELGEVPSQTFDEGIVSFQGCHYVGITTECSIEEMASTMNSDFGDLMLWVDDEEIEVIGEPLTIYHKMDRIKNECAFTVAVPIDELPEEIPDPYHTGKIPPLKAHKLTHEGPYRHLGNVWALGQMMIRDKSIKTKKGFPPFETYLNDPQDTADELLETAVFFPVDY